MRAVISGLLYSTFKNYGTHVRKGLLLESQYGTTHAQNSCPPHSLRYVCNIELPNSTKIHRDIHYS